MCSSTTAMLNNNGLSFRLYAHNNAMLQLGPSVEQKIIQSFVWVLLHLSVKGS